LVAFGLGAYFVSLSYPEKIERYPSYEGRNSTENGAAGSVANVTQAKMQKAPCNDPQSETESDLCAQWRAAQAAEKSSVWTMYGVLASIAGISLLLWQITLTRKAVTDTGVATKAMQEANDIARQTQAAQLRAYVNFKGVRLRKDNMFGSQKEHILFAIHNQGTVPATLIELFVRTQYFTINDSARVTLAEEYNRYPAVYFGDEVQVQPVLFKSNLIPPNTPVYLCIRGYIKYSDRFSQKRRTDFDYGFAKPVIIELISDDIDFFLASCVFDET